MELLRSSPIVYRDACDSAGTLEESGQRRTTWSAAFLNQENTSAVGPSMSPSAAIAGKRVDLGYPTAAR